MTMDVETLEVLLELVATLWPEPALTEVERDRWHRVLRPCWSVSLDPDLVAGVLLSLRDDPALGDARPNVDAFRAIKGRSTVTTMEFPPERTKKSPIARSMPGDHQSVFLMRSSAVQIKKVRPI